MNKKIDLHTHILPKKLPPWKTQFGYGGFVHLAECPGCTQYDMSTDEGKFFRRIDLNCVDAEVRKKEMRHQGVTQQVLSTVPIMFSYWAKPKDGLIVSQYLNDHLAEVVHKDAQSFYGLGTVPLQDPELACQELHRIHKDLRLTGVQIGSHVENWNLSDSVFDPFWKECESLGLSVFVHPWDMMGQDRMQKYWLPWLVGMPAETSLAICSMIFGGVFQRFPKLRVAFAHGGGAFPFTLGRIQHGFEARPDLVAVDCKVGPKDFVGKFWVDTLVHSPKALNFLIDTMGEDKVCLGTDYPFPLGELEPGGTLEKAMVDRSNQASGNSNSENEINKNLRDMIFYKNAQKFLGIP